MAQYVGSAAEPDIGFLSPNDDLGNFRELLRRSVGRISTTCRAKVDESDIVQETLLEAHANKEAFRGKSEAELIGWLERSLSRNLVDAVRRLRCRKRNIANELQIHRAADMLGVRTSLQLPAEHTSPSGKAMRNEEFDRMQEAIGQLPDAQREAVTLHHMQGMTLVEVAAHMSRSLPAVAGLLHRGLQAIKHSMGK